ALDGLEAQADRQVGLADARRPEDDKVLPVLDEVTRAQGLDLLLVERGLVAEVEGVESLNEGEAGQLRAHGDVLRRLGGHFLGEDLVEEVGVGKLLGGGVLELGLEPIATLEQPQALQVLLEALELGGGHAGTPASAKSRAVEALGATVRRGAAIWVSPTRASYTARSRISTTVDGVVRRGAGRLEGRCLAVRALAPGPWP